MQKKTSAKRAEKSDHWIEIDKLVAACPSPDKLDIPNCEKCLSKIIQALALSEKSGKTFKRVDIIYRLVSCHNKLGRMEQMKQYAQQFLGLIPPDEPDERAAGVYSVIAKAYWNEGDMDAAWEANYQAMQISRKFGLNAIFAGSCMNLSSILRSRGKPEEALVYLDMALDALQDQQDTDQYHQIQGNKAIIYYSIGRLEAALELIQESIRHFSAKGNLRQQAIDLNTASIIYNKMNRLDKAIEYGLSSLKIKDKLNDKRSLISSWTNLGVFFKEFGNLETAAEYYKLALAGYQELGDKRGYSMVLNNLGSLCMETERYQEALEYFLEAYDLKIEVNDLSEMHSLLANISTIYRNQELYPQAEEYASRALESARQAGNVFSTAENLLWMAWILTHTGITDAAGDFLKQAWQIIEANSYQKLIPNYHEVAAGIEKARSKYKNACFHHEQRISALEKLHQYEITETVAEMQAKYQLEKKEYETELLRHKNTELEAKNIVIESQKQALQETLDKLDASEIRFNFVSEALNQSGKTTLIGTSEAIRNVTKMISLVSRSDHTNVLITGETGTGKEIVARNIHACSARKRNQFYAVNCSAVTETLFESQFFGHEKDAFTGANTAKIGWFEIADKSTLFLDEISSMSTDQQAKMLRVLEDRKLVRVGSHREIPVDVRIISASNHNLLAEIDKAQFRSDLYHRLAIFVINIPPLRERKEDIPVLTEHFTALLSQVMNKRVTRINKSIYPLLMDYNYPGNVRELRNMVERAILLAKTSTLQPDDFAFPGQPAFDRQVSSLTSLDELERDALIKALKTTGFNRARAAILLGVHRKVVERRIKKYSITPSDL